MAEPRPEVSVVVGTHQRADRLEGLLAGLRAQSLDADRFEVVVVDDASTDRTPDVLEAELERGQLHLRVIRQPQNAGWAAAKEAGWRVAQSDLVAFTDDDCVPDPEWLEAGLTAAASEPGAIVQGRTEPIPGELEALPPARRPFTRTISVPSPDPAFQTCNVFYPRAVLEAAGGFDVESFVRAPGEDADLAWRAIAGGTPTAFAPDAVVRHAVNELGPVGKLRHAARWDMRVYARHPELRRRHFYRYGRFWKRSHFWLARALLGLVVPRRLWPVRAWLAYPYARNLYGRGRAEGGGLRLVPYYVVYDLVEVVTVLRSAIRERTPMF